MLSSNQRSNLQSRRKLYKSCVRSICYILPSMTIISQDDLKLPYRDSHSYFLTITNVSTGYLFQDQSSLFQFILISVYFSVNKYQHTPVAPGSELNEFQIVDDPPKGTSRILVLVLVSEHCITSSLILLAHFYSNHVLSVVYQHCSILGAHRSFLRNCLPHVEFFIVG